jgi:hypothetical protein
VRAFKNLFRPGKIGKLTVSIGSPCRPWSLISPKRAEPGTAGSAPDSALPRSFQGTAPEFYEVGDCREARRILEAIHGGHEAARKL